MRDPGDVAVSLASLEEGGFSWVSPQLLQAADVAGKKKKSLASLRTRSWGSRGPRPTTVPQLGGPSFPSVRTGSRGLPSGGCLQHPPTQSIWEGRPLRRCCKEVQAFLPLNYSWGGWLAPSRCRGPVWMEGEKLRCANRPIQGPRRWKFPGA